MADNEITKWEYKQVPFYIDDLQKMGEEGWEATGNSNPNGILLKRPKKTQTQQRTSEPYPGYSR